MGAWVAGRMEADAGILYGTGTEVVALAEGGVVIPFHLDLPCNANARPERVLAIGGENDPVYARPIGLQLQAIAGTECSVSPCVADRAWIEVPDAETLYGAGHGVDGDPAWMANLTWGLQANIDWLLQK